MEMQKHILEFGGKVLKVNAIILLRVWSYGILTISLKTRSMDMQKHIFSFEVVSSFRMVKRTSFMMVKRTVKKLQI